MAKKKPMTATEAQEALAKRMSQENRTRREIHAEIKKLKAESRKGPPKKAKKTSGDWKNK